MSVIDAILELELLGFVFTLDGINIQYTHQGDRPAPALVGLLLDTIKENKLEAIGYLQKRTEEVDITAHLLAQADKALRKGDFDRWIRLLEAASLERSRSYAQNEHDRRRCPGCPYLGREPLEEMGGKLVLCDVPCPGPG